MNYKEYPVYERYRTGKKWYNWCYRREWRTRYVGWKAACATNSEYYKKADGNPWLAPKAEISLECVCNNNITTNAYKTPYYADTKAEKEFIKDGTQEIPSGGPRFSTAETFGDGKFIDTRKRTSPYSVCTCDINTELVDTEATYYDVSEYYTCACNTNTKTNPYSGRGAYSFTFNQKFTNEGFVAGSKYPDGKKVYKYKIGTCSANRTIKEFVDWRQFWHNTTNKKGPDTK